MTIFGFAFALVAITGIFFVREDVTDIKTKMDRVIDASREIHSRSLKTMENADESLKQSRETSIWILRRDILNSIDTHENSRQITAKEYKRIKDEFEHYKSIGGNHDVAGRFDDFNTKIFGT